MEKELNVPEINNVFNDEIAAQIKEIESRLEKEEPKNEPQKQTVEIKEPRIVPQVETKEEVKELKEQPKDNGFDSMFSSLYNDVAGANNFISNLIEQKKKVNLNEASLNEEKQKLVKLEQAVKVLEKHKDKQKEAYREEQKAIELKQFSEIGVQRFFIRAREEAEEEEMLERLNQLESE